MDDKQFARRALALFLDSCARVSFGRVGLSGRLAGHEFVLTVRAGDSRSFARLPRFHANRAREMMSRIDAGLALGPNVC
jgi:hypothetical protein